MKFELQGIEISGTELKITAESAPEVMEVYKHFHLDRDHEGVFALADALRVGRFEYISRAKAHRPWFGVDVYLDRALAPYYKLLKYCTGFEAGGLVPTMDLSVVYPNRLGHTHVTDSIGIVDGMIHAHVFIQAQDWNDRDAATNAQRNADDYIQDVVGKRKWEREFIQNGSGNYSHNPNYGRVHHRAEPGIGAPWLWDAIFAWWRRDYATDQQRAVLDAVDALRSGYKHDPDYTVRKGGGDEAHLVGYSLYALDPAGTCNYDGKGKMARVYNWEEFQKLGAGVSKS